MNRVIGFGVANIALVKVVYTHTDFISSPMLHES